MIVARVIDGGRGEAELELALRRLGLPGAARDYMREKVLTLDVLLTGLSRTEGSFLKHCGEASMAPGREEFPAYVPGDVAKRPGTALLAGRRDQFERLVARCRREDALVPFANALESALSGLRVPGPLRLDGRELVFGRRTLIMGVVNVTPDSFSDGGKLTSAEAAVSHALELERAGADILDVGGESSRPGATPVSADEELSRVLPLIRGIRAQSTVPISVDTYKAAVAEKAIEAGAQMVNDISALSIEPRLAFVVAGRNAAICLMHMKGTPRTMQENPSYDDVVHEVIEALCGSIERAVEAGISRERILIDPGIGFGKTPAHNLFLLRALGQLRCLGRPILLGTSRKSFIGQLTGRPAHERQYGTAGSIATAAGLGWADIVRVHDVAEMREVLAVVDAIRSAEEGGVAYALPRRG